MASRPRAEPLEETFDRCIFCDTFAVNEHVGRKYRLKDLIMHNNCVLLANGAVRIDRKTDGARGADYDDVKQSRRDAITQQCYYCEDFGAATDCHTCGIYFHLPCGRRNGAITVFKESFWTYCRLHRPIQRIPRAVAAEPRGNPPECIFCSELIDVDNDEKTLWAPCCNKLFHRKCIQQMANHSGAYFKCPMCNSVGRFKEEMINHGIFIENRAPSWEGDATAADIANIRHNTCDVVPCLCPHGNRYNLEGTALELILCSSCAARGTHVICSLLGDRRTWECDGCIAAGRVARANRV